MSDSAPSDLAIAFRSLPRRLREARGELGDAAIAGQLHAVERRLARAAQLVRSTAAPAAIADAIEATPADGWGTELDELRAIALDLGREVRAIAAANPDLES